MKFIHFLFLLPCLCGLQFLSAQEGPPPSASRVLLEGGLEFGGDELVNLTFTNGETQDMLAGQGGYLAFGGDIDPPNSPFLFRGTIGIKYNTTAAENANINLVRYPINVLTYLQFGSGFRAGGGITKHLGTRLKGDGFVTDLKFKSSVGMRFEMGWRYFALSYTRVNYSPDLGTNISAANFGLSVSTTIPSKY